MDTVDPRTRPPANPPAWKSYIPSTSAIVETGLAAIGSYVLTARYAKSVNPWYVTAGTSGICYTLLTDNHVTRFLKRPDSLSTITTALSSYVLSKHFIKSTDPLLMATVVTLSRVFSEAIVAFLKNRFLPNHLLINDKNRYALILVRINIFEAIQFLPTLFLSRYLVQRCSLPLDPLKDHLLIQLVGRFANSVLNQINDLKNYVVY